MNTFIFNNGAVQNGQNTNRNHIQIYPGEPPAFFDLSQIQQDNAINADWRQIKVDEDIACVVTGTDKVRDPKRIRCVYRIRSLTPRVRDNVRVFRGDLIGEVLDERRYNFVLREHGVQHIRLRPESCFFCTGFNLANLGNKLDKLEVRLNNQKILHIGAIRHGEDINP
jgi:hypothetical protein